MQSGVKSFSSQRSSKQLARNLYSLTLVQVANYVLPLISVPVISRIIGPENFGTINFAAVFIAYFSLVIGYSFDLTATRRIAVDPNNIESRNQIISEVLQAKLLLFIAATICFVVLIFSMEEFSEVRNVLVYTYSLCIGAVLTQNWLFQGMQDLNKVAFFQLLSKVLFTVIVLIVIREKQDFIWQPLLLGMTQILASVLSFWYAWRRYKIRLKKVGIDRVLNILKEGRVVFLSLIVVNLYTTTNIFILGVYQNSDQVGFYAAGYRLILIAQAVLTIPLAQAFYPFIGHAMAESREKGLQVARKLIPAIIAFVGFFSVLMFLAGPWVIRLFYGPEFENAVIVFQTLSIIPLLVALSNVLGIQIMLNLSMDKPFFYITAVAACVSVILNLATIERWGYLATTFIWVLTETFILISMYIFLRRKGIDPINPHYFKASFILTYLRPITSKLFPR